MSWAARVMACCTTRSDEAQLSHRGSPRRASVERPPSPVSRYLEGVLDDKEQLIFRQLKERNRELRSRLSLPLDGDPTHAAVFAKVEEHFGRLRAAVAENTRLKNEVKWLKETLPAVESGAAEPPPGLPGSVAVVLHRRSLGGSCGEGANRCASAMLAEIQGLTQANIKLNSDYDDEVKRLESELDQMRRRRQEAEMTLRLPPSVRALTRSRSGEAGPATPAEEPPTAEQEEEIQLMHLDCASLATELDALRADERAFEQRTVEELQMVHQMHADELEHFRQLVQEKRLGAGGGPAATASKSIGLLEAELEQLQEHLEQAKIKAEQERVAAEGYSDQLRVETKQFEEALSRTRAEKHQMMEELEELKKSSWASSVEADRKHEEQRQREEEMLKEVERERHRVEQLDVEIERLRNELGDMQSRSDFFIRSLPSEPALVAASQSVGSAGASQLEQALAERQRRLAELRRRGSALDGQLAAAAEAERNAQLDVTVAEQRVLLLQRRLSPVM